MKLLFTACTGCGARSTSAFGLCQECEDKQLHARVRARLERRQVRRGRRAA